MDGLQKHKAKVESKSRKQKVLQLTLSGCIFVILDESGQAEVSDLAHHVVGDQDVGRTQVSVDVVHPLNKRHPIRDLLKTKRTHASMRLWSSKSGSRLILMN